MNDDLQIQEKVRQDTIAALEECERGETIPHAVVMKWLSSLGTENELPMPTSRKI